MVGNVRINIGGNQSGTIVMGNYIVKDSYNKLLDNDEAVAEAISVIDDHIGNNYQGSENEAAIKDIFQQLQNGIANKHDAHILKVFWDGLITLTPTVNTLTNAVSTITNLFTSK
ncbi:hypothetical protein EAG18_07510 [Pseudoalteromonas sp. J010]|uniref:hypothetical protein n=1 Tax=Pseudoalteromonas sp. J010 TaxID=998465 RepID=UPI000F6498E3|nr:hypothetical protein [Pseudoalteromonas sp. J010]RRS09281.1 hypothetical protein EAG18_07510 [Pseudoalteromonas sp. J010]